MSVVLDGGREVVTLHRERMILMPHEYMDRYERWMRSAGRSERTIRQRTRMAGRVLARWPDPGRVEVEDLIDWKASMSHLQRWTQATYHSDIRAFFKWLHQAGHIIEDPSASKMIERPRARDGVPKPLSPVEETRALSAAHGNIEAWLLLALRAGLRASEIAGVRGEYVAEDHIIIVGKGDKEAAIPTHPDVWALAQRFPRQGWWFPSPQHDGHVSGRSVTVLIGRHFRDPAVNIPKGSIHRCRHSYATTLLRRGANMRQVQTLMRHSSPATTAIYTAVDEDELRAAILLLPSSDGGGLPPAA